MKHQALFPQKDISKKIKCRLLQCLFGALRVNISTMRSEQALQNRHMLLWKLTHGLPLPSIAIYSYSMRPYGLIFLCKNTWEIRCPEY